MPHKPRGRCAANDVDPDLFFANDQDSVAAAKQLCHACPIQDECLAESLEDGSQYGTFGGLSEAERRTLLRRHRHGPRSAAA